MEAFEALALDPNDPFDWRSLVYSLAHILFPPMPSRPRQQWTTEKCEQFKFRVGRIKRVLSSKENFAMIAKNYPENKLRPNDLRKKMSRARYEAEIIAREFKELWPQDYQYNSLAALSRYVRYGPPGPKKTRKRFRRPR
jgi:hypothetical protein